MTRIDTAEQAEVWLHTYIGVHNNPDLPAAECVGKLVAAWEERVYEAEAYAGAPA